MIKGSSGSGDSINDEIRAVVMLKKKRIVKWGLAGILTLIVLIQLTCQGLALHFYYSQSSPDNGTN